MTSRDDYPVGTDTRDSDGASRMESYGEIATSPQAMTEIVARLSELLEPHEFSRRRGWRWWICSACYAPRSLHPRKGWTRSRPLGDNTYLSADAPHFKEGW